MSSVVTVEHITLDGVYQEPAHPDAETQYGFEYGGWSKAGDDPAMQKVIGKYMAGGWSLLVGRTTYEELYDSWHMKQPSAPMTQALTGVRKFVASHDPDYELPW